MQDGGTGSMQNAASTASLRFTDAQSGFIGALESVRGLAALTVLVFHSAAFLRHVREDPLEKTLWALKSADETARRAVSLVFNGHVAVSLFFVLSGFVLALSLQRDSRSFERQAAHFCARRFFRICPAFAANLLLTATIVSMVAAAFPGVGYSSFTYQQLIANISLFKFEINGATWTLLLEMLAIPLLLLGHLLSRRFGRGGVLVLAILTVVFLFSRGWVRALAPGDALLFVRTYIVDYQFMFVFGMLAAELPLRKRLENKSLAVTVGMIVALAAMLGARFLLGYSSRWSLLIEGAAAAALVGLLARGPRLGIHRLLEWHPIRFLGRISYSFYLYHVTALLLVVPTTISFITAAGAEAHPFLATAIVAPMTVILTVPLAWLSYRWIEHPMMDLGQRHLRRASQRAHDNSMRRGASESR
jgi:peptidoglycan/LPS O-acetylase OafA/YrhL